MATQAEIDATVAKILADIIVAYKEIQLKDFFECLIKLMECAEAIPMLIGADKKKVVIGVLKAVIEKIPFKKQSDKEIVMFIVNSGIVGLIIDTIVGLTKKGCKINVPQIIKEHCKCIIC